MKKEIFDFVIDQMIKQSSIAIDFLEGEHLMAWQRINDEFIMNFKKQLREVLEKENT